MIEEGSSAPDFELQTDTGDTVRVARDALIAGGKNALPQCGTTVTEQGKAIVLSGLTASITDPATAETITC